MHCIPAAASQALHVCTGLAPEQVDTILQLVCLPENGEREWWKHYGYIEKLGDGRGYTATIFGACSGTGDLLMVFDALARICPTHVLLKYHDGLRHCRGENVSAVRGMLKDLPAHGDDDAWRTAVWEVYIQLYWRFAAAFAAKTGECAHRPGPALLSPLATGFMLDTAINHGADMESFSKIVRRMKSPNSTSETAWLADFIATRKCLLQSGFEHLDTSKTGDRCKLWNKLLDEGNLALERPIRAARGYWGKGVVIH